MSLAACINRCPTTTRSPWFENSLGPRRLLQHRRVGLLDLEEQRVLAVAAEHQRDPRARADAPDPDHLVREVGQLELLEQHPAVELRASHGSRAAPLPAVPTSRSNSSPVASSLAGTISGD